MFECTVCRVCRVCRVCLSRPDTSPPCVKAMPHRADTSRIRSRRRLSGHQDSIWSIVRASGTVQILGASPSRPVIPPILALDSTRARCALPSWSQPTLTTRGRCAHLSARVRHGVARRILAPTSPRHCTAPTHSPPKSSC